MPCVEAKSFVEVFVTHHFVMPGRMMFGKIVGHVGDTFSPDELVLFLQNTIPDPIDPHIKGFGKFLTHCGIQDSSGRGIIVKKRGSLSGLRMTQFSQGNSHGACSLNCKIEASSFSFGSRCHNILYSVAHDVDGCISHGMWMVPWIVAENIPCCGARSCFW